MGFPLGNGLIYGLVPLFHQGGRGGGIREPWWFVWAKWLLVPPCVFLPWRPLQQTRIVAHTAGVAADLAGVRSMAKIMLNKSSLNLAANLGMHGHPNLAVPVSGARACIMEAHTNFTFFSAQGSGLKIPRTNLVSKACFRNAARFVSHEPCNQLIPTRPDWNCPLPRVPKTWGEQKTKPRQSKKKPTRQRSRRY